MNSEMTYRNRIGKQQYEDDFSCPSCGFRGVVRRNKTSAGKLTLTYCKCGRVKVIAGRDKREPKPEDNPGWGI